MIFFSFRVFVCIILKKESNKLFDVQCFNHKKKLNILLLSLLISFKCHSVQNETLKKERSIADGKKATSVDLI